MREIKIDKWSDVVAYLKKGAYIKKHKLFDETKVWRLMNKKHSPIVNLTEEIVNELKQKNRIMQGKPCWVFNPQWREKQRNKNEKIIIPIYQTKISDYANIN